MVSHGSLFLQMSFSQLPGYFLFSINHFQAGAVGSPKTDQCGLMVNQDHQSKRVSLRSRISILTCINVSLLSAKERHEPARQDFGQKKLCQRRGKTSPPGCFQIYVEFKLPNKLNFLPPGSSVGFLSELLSFFSNH